MLFPLLQTTPSVEEVATQAADSVAVDLEQFAHNLITNPSGTLEHLGQDIINFGLKLLAALAIYLVGAWLIRRIKKALGNMFAKRKTEKALASFIMSFTTIGLTILLIIISISTLGVDTTSIAALIAAAGVAIGMALSGTVENFAGGIMILAFKPFKAGDYIEAQGYEGTVTAVSIVSTTIGDPAQRHPVQRQHQQLLPLPPAPRGLEDRRGIRNRFGKMHRQAAGAREVRPQGAGFRHARRRGPHSDPLGTRRQRRGLLGEGESTSPSPRWTSTFTTPPTAAPPPQGTDRLSSSDGRCAAGCIPSCLSTGPGLRPAARSGPTSARSR